MFEASIPYNVGTTVIGDWTRECGYHAASQLLSQGVTAIYAFSDKMISGVYTYCIEHRISVGKDISLFGFDDSDIVHAYTPPLASAKPDLQEMGHKAAELVLAQLQGKLSAQSVMCFPVRFMCVRRSVPSGKHSLDF